MTHDPTLQEQTIAISFKEFRDEEIVGFFANENRSFCPDSVQDNNLFRSRIVGSPHFLKRMKQKEKQKPSAVFQPSVQIHDSGTENVFPDTKKHAGDQTKNSSVDSVEYSQPIIRVARLEEREKQKRKKTPEPSFGKPTRPLGALLVLGNNGSTENRAAKIVCDPLDKQSRKLDFLQKKRFSTAPTFQTEIRDNTILTPGKSKEVFSSISSSTSGNGLEDADIQIAMTPDDVVAFPGSSKTENVLMDRIRETDEQLKNLIDSWPKLSDRLKETINALIEVSQKETSS